MAAGDRDSTDAVSGLWPQSPHLHSGDSSAPSPNSSLLDGRVGDMWALGTFIVLAW